MSAEWNGKTVEGFYERHVQNGRAILRGEPAAPDIWLTRPDALRSAYCLCFDNRDGLRMVQGDMRLSDLAEYIEKMGAERLEAKRRKYGGMPAPRLDRRTTSRKPPSPHRRRWGVPIAELPYLAVARVLDPDV